MACFVIPLTKSGSRATLGSNFWGWPISFVRCPAVNFEALGNAVGGAKHEPWDVRTWKLSFMLLLLLPLIFLLSYCVDTRGWWQFSHATLWHYYDSGLSRVTVLFSESSLKYSYIYLSVCFGNTMWVIEECFRNKSKVFRSSGFSLLSV